MNAVKNANLCVRWTCGMILLAGLCMGQGCPSPTVPVEEPDDLAQLAPSSSGRDPQTQTPAQPQAGLQTPGGAQGGSPSQAASTCPSSEEMRARMAPATYAVVVEYQDPRLRPWAAGTAFAIGDHLLATNAHVAAAIIDSQSVGSPVRNIVGVQAGTGVVVKLLRAVPHPKYTGTNSPDVALLTTDETLPNVLPLASDNQVADLVSGNAIELTGFPGDVNEQIAPIIPGTTIPQATALSGQIGALRSFDATVAVTPATTDIIQHQAPTSPGTSGSPMVRCGTVVGVNNAGTIDVFVRGFDANGNPIVDRTPAAANNFGIHVKHLRHLLSLFQSNAAPAVDLPAPFNGAAPFAGTYQGAVQGSRPHQFAFAVQANGQVTGVAVFGQTQLELTGLADAFGNVILRDNRDQFQLQIGIYVGSINPQTGQASGRYSEGRIENALGQWTATLGGSNGGTGGQSGGNGSSFAGSYQGSATGGQSDHSFRFTVDSSGQITGTSTWGESTFELTGTVDAAGNLAIQDNGAQFNVPVGIYVGRIDPQTGQASGSYSEGTAQNVLAQWTAARGSSSNASSNNGANAGASSASFTGSVTGGDSDHEFRFTINGNGQVTGRSTWGSNTFELSGTVDSNGKLRMQDNGAQFDLGTGVYAGTINFQTGQASGAFGIDSQALGQWTARLAQ